MAKRRTASWRKLRARTETSSHTMNWGYAAWHMLDSGKNNDSMEPESTSGLGVLELAIVVPTYNEKSNVIELLEALEKTMRGVRWEVIFVDDDSPDGTASLVRGLALHDPRVRVLQRVGRRGLSSACVEGMLATAAPYIAVMDADMQHDETILPQMFSLLKERQLDLVIASRLVGDG